MSLIADTAFRIGAGIIIDKWNKLQNKLSLML